MRARNSEKEIISSISGFVLDQEDNILANLDPYYYTSGNYQTEYIEVIKEGQERDREGLNSFQLIASFSPYTVNHIENNRMKNPYRDVV